MATLWSDERVRAAVYEANEVMDEEAILAWRAFYGPPDYAARQEQRHRRATGVRFALTRSATFTRLALGTDPRSIRERGIGSILSITTYTNRLRNVCERYSSMCSDFN